MATEALDLLPKHVMSDMGSSEQLPQPPGSKRRREKQPIIPFWQLIRPRVGAKRFLRDLWSEFDRDKVTSGAAVVAYFSMLAIFPGAILLLSLLPYLPIPNLTQNILGLMHEAMPAPAADLFTSTVVGVVSERRGGLLSASALGTVWAASSGILAMMDQINGTYRAVEKRPFWKTRAIAVVLVFVTGALIIGSFCLIVVGGILQDWWAKRIGLDPFVVFAFATLRWSIIFTMLSGALSFIYHYGPNVKQHYRFLSPGGLVATVLLALASVAFRIYVENFGSYQATYGSLGAAIILLLWLYVGGLVVLIGSEVNFVLEGYARARMQSEAKNS